MSSKVAYISRLQSSAPSFNLTTPTHSPLLSIAQQPGASHQLLCFPHNILVLSPQLLRFPYFTRISTLSRTQKHNGKRVSSHESFTIECLNFLCQYHLLTCLAKCSDQSVSVVRRITAGHLNRKKAGSSTKKPSRPPNTGLSSKNQESEILCHICRRVCSLALSISLAFLSAHVHHVF